MWARDPVMDPASTFSSAIESRHSVPHGRPVVVRKKTNERQKERDDDDLDRQKPTTRHIFRQWE